MAMNLKVGNNSLKVNSNTDHLKWQIKLINVLGKWIKKIEKTEIINTRNERRVIITDHMNIKKFYEQLYAHKFDNLAEMDQFSERHNLAKLTQGKMKSPISAKEIE